MTPTLIKSGRGLEPISQDYFDQPWLSYSAMKDLAVSPMRFWHLHVNPNRPLVEPTREMQIGQALHCAVLEPSAFDARYACELIPPDDCLDTMDQIRAFIRECGHTPKGTRKAEAIAQAQAISAEVPILEVLKARHAEQNHGRTIFPVDDWGRIQRCARALMAEPVLLRLLEQGEPERPFFAKDPTTGVALKAKMDWVAPGITLDLKTFQQKRSKSLDESVADAIYFERYYLQAYFYTMMRVLQPDGDRKNPPDFVMAFVESEEPHEVRIKALRPKTAGQPNLYWEQARLHVMEMIRLYADCLSRYGSEPWRDEQAIDPLIDGEIRALAFA